MVKNRSDMVLAEGARVFLEALPYEAGEKIACNIRCVKDGEIGRELFKRLDDSDRIRGLRTLYRRVAYRLFAFWDTESETLVIAAPRRL